jgi:hypothetical protein
VTNEFNQLSQQTRLANRIRRSSCDRDAMWRPSLRCIIANKLWMLPDAFQMFKSSHSVLQISSQGRWAVNPIETQSFRRRSLEHLQLIASIGDIRGLFANYGRTHVTNASNLLTTVNGKPVFRSVNHCRETIPLPLKGDRRPWMRWCATSGQICISLRTITSVRDQLRHAMEGFGVRCSPSGLDRQRY